MPANIRKNYYVPVLRYGYLLRIWEIAGMDQRAQGKIIREFGRNLKRIRMEKGLSVRQLADLAEVNLGNLSDLELGKRNPMLTTVVGLARALEIDVRELIPK